MLISLALEGMGEQAAFKSLGTGLSSVCLAGHADAVVVNGKLWFMTEDVAWIQPTFRQVAAEHERVLPRMQGQTKPLFVCFNALF